MESFKIWMMSICGATAVSAIFKLLLADSSLKKVINVFFSIFILFYTVIPIQSFFNGSINLQTDTEDISYNEYYEEGYNAVVTKSVTNVCNEIGVKVLSIDIYSYIDDEGYLNVHKIVINTDSKNYQEIEEKIKNELGFEVEVE